MPHRLRRDHRHPYRLRVYREEFAGLDPLALPWREMRKYPENFPGRHIAKVSSLRTVVGMDVSGASGNSHRLYIKRSFTRGRWRGLLAPLRPSKEWREFETARRFLERGFIVPEPVFYAEATSEGLPTRFYATIALGPRWVCARDWFRGEGLASPAWRALASFTRALHQGGTLHADYRADHLYLDPESDLTEWAMIDLDGSRLGAAVKPRERRRAILQLAQSLIPAGLDEEALAHFLSIYDTEAHFALDAREIIAQARENIANRPPKTK